MFGLGGKKTKKGGGFTGVSLLADGVAVACVARGKEGPALRACRHFSLDTPGSLDEVLRQAAAEPACQGLPVSGVLGPDDFSLILVERPPVADEELRAAVQWKIGDMLDYPVEEAVIDVLTIPGGRTEMIYVVAARQSRVREHIERLERARFPLEVVDIPEMAQRNLASLLPEDATGVAMLSVRGSEGLLTITHGATLFLSRRLETGLDDLAPDMGLDLPDSDGGDESLSLEAISPQQQQVMDGVVLEIQRSLDYYESHFAQPPVGALVLAPTVRPVDGLLDYLSANLGVRVRALDLSEVLTLSSPLDEVDQARGLLAIGAALRAGLTP